MATGVWNIPCTIPTVLGGGPWSAGNIASISALGEPPASLPVNGTAAYTLGDNLIWLIPAGEPVATPTRILELPHGFQFLNISQGPDAPGFLYGAGFSDPVANKQLTDWAVPALGWTPGVTPFGEAQINALLVTAMTATGEYDVNFYDISVGVFNINEPPDGINNSGLFGDYDDLGDQVTPGEATVELGPGDNEITITPGPDTVIVVVDDGDEEQIIEVDEGVPVVVEVGATPVTVTPVNYPIAVGPPTEVDVPIIFEMTGIIPIDIALAPSMRLVCNPSGIYTLVPGQKYDVLYERVAGTTVATSQTVAIPRPYGITTYIPEQD